VLVRAPEGALEALRILLENLRRAQRRHNDRGCALHSAVGLQHIEERFETGLGHCAEPPAHGLVKQGGRHAQRDRDRRSRRRGRQLQARLELARQLVGEIQNPATAK
jgi:hypothetical protein